MLNFYAIISTKRVKPFQTVSSDSKWKEIEHKKTYGQFNHEPFTSVCMKYDFQNFKYQKAVASFRTSKKTGSGKQAWLLLIYL